MDAAKALTPFFLGGMGLFVVASELYVLRKKIVLWIAGLFVFTLGVEIVGLHTGAVFGEYVYGRTLGPKIGGVPAVIGLNWVVIILCLTALADRFFKSGLLSAAAVFILAVGYDLVLEPLAVRLDYWSWKDSVIPLQNYLAWGAVPVLCFALFRRLMIKLNDHLLTHVFFIQTGYFLLLRIYFGLRG
ncbi:MAG: carotenoid biosynthesis protein [Candidatus Aminicenantes bacterium]|nr:carotenoid biosynthesis protein [Candidatus Aminicenantes bacterium]